MLTLECTHVFMGGMVSVRDTLGFFHTTVLICTSRVLPSYYLLIEFIICTQKSEIDVWLGEIGRMI